MSVGERACIQIEIFFHDSCTSTPVLVCTQNATCTATPCSCVLLDTTCLSATVPLNTTPPHCCDSSRFLSLVPCVCLCTSSMQPAKPVCSLHFDRAPFFLPPCLCRSRAPHCNFCAQSVVEAEFAKELELGADGILQDECQHHVAHVCFDPDHNHRRGASTYREDRALIQNLTRMAAAARGDNEFAFAGESPCESAVVVEQAC